MICEEGEVGVEVVVVVVVVVVVAFDFWEDFSSDMLSIL